MADEEKEIINISLDNLNLFKAQYDIWVNSKLAQKQNVLTAGENITIAGNQISCSIPTATTEDILSLFSGTNEIIGTRWVTDNSYPVSNTRITADNLSVDDTRLIL